jgi:threonyl-tRNA synthetase
MRRLPWEDDGKRAYTPVGAGLVNSIADALERELISTAREDAERAQRISDDPAASRAELRAAVRYLSAAVRDVSHVAELREERLPEYEAPAGQVLWHSKAEQIGQALRDVLRQDLH